MTAFRVSVQIRPQHCTYAQMRDAWMRAEELGTDGLFTWDHFYPLFGEPDGPHFECWTILAAMAESTEKPVIGALVSPVAYRNPQLIADMARTLDHISNGRAILGYGAGWFERDYVEYGYEFGDAKSRLAEFRAALPVIKERIGKLNPGPVNGHVPLMIGGGGEQVMLKLVAVHADIWHGFGEPSVIEHKCKVLDAHCATVGRDPSQIERSIFITEADLQHMDAFVAAGVTHFIAGGDGPEFELSVLEKLLAWRKAQ